MGILRTPVFSTGDRGFFWGTGDRGFFWGTGDRGRSPLRGRRESRFCLLRERRGERPRSPGRKPSDLCDFACKNDRDFADTRFFHGRPRIFWGTGDRGRSPLHRRRESRFCLLRERRGERPRSPGRKPSDLCDFACKSDRDFADTRFFHGRPRTVAPT